MKKSINKSSFSIRTETATKYILLLFVFLVLVMGSAAFAASLNCPKTVVTGQPFNCTLDISDIANVVECNVSEAREITPWNATPYGVVSDTKSCTGYTARFDYLSQPGAFYGLSGARITQIVYCLKNGVKSNCGRLEAYIDVVLPTPSVTLTCPASVNPTENATCTVTNDPIIGTPSSYTWSAPDAQLTPIGNTAALNYVNPGQYTANVNVVSDVSRGTAKFYQCCPNGYPVTFTGTANIEVLAPQVAITSLSCPSDLWIGQTGNCSATGWSSWGTVRFMWNSSGTTVSNNDTATVKFNQSGQGTVTVTAYLVENPFITKQQTFPINVKIPQLTTQLDCASNLFPGQQGSCTSSGTTEWGTIGYRWNSSGVVSGSGNTANVVFQDIGPGSVTMTAYLVEAPTVTTSAIDVVSVNDPMVNVFLDCPASLWITQNGTCTASGNTLFGTLMYTWNSTNGNVSSGTNNTATVNYSQPGQGDVTVTAYLLEAPKIKTTGTANIAVNSPQITAQLDCPQQLWIGEPGNCTVNAATDYGTLTYKWTSSGIITPANENATVSFNKGGPGTVDVEVSLAELPNIMFKKTTNITIEAPKITGTLTCPQSLWIGEPGNCVVDAVTDWGTLQYEWSSSGSVTGNVSTANIIFPGSGEGAVTVKVSLVELPTVSITLNAAVTVNAPDITAQLDCPTELWKNNVGTCSVTASTSWGNLQYEWTSSGVIVSAGNTATVSFPQQGGGFVNVKVFVVEVPAANVTLTSNIYVNGYRKPYVTISGKRFIYVKESGAYSIGDVYSPSGPVDLTWSIDDQALGSGDSITYTFNDVKKYIIKVTSRVQGSGSDPDAEGVSIFNVYSSNYPAPKIAIERPRLIFLNEPADFKVKVYTQSGLDRQLFGRWVLPDGSYQQGESQTYTFTTLDMKEIRYEAWFEGYEDNTASQSVRVTPREYVFPDYSIWSYTGSEGVVPYYAIFKADGNLQKATGKIITYNWDFGDGTFYTTSRTRYARKEYTQPGQYSVTMQAIDEDGNTDTETFPLNLRLPDPIVLSIKKSFTNRYMKAPLGAFLTTRKTGGHPRDSILTYEWKLNNKNISNKYAASVKMYDPGKYDLSLNINTKFGYSSSVIDTVTATENQSPICDFIYDDKPAYSVTYFTAKCTDSDGSIVKYNWDFGNGTTSGMYRTYARYEAAGSYTVTLTGTDDSGTETKVSKTITIQR